MAKKGKTLVKSFRYYELLDDFPAAHQKCIHAGIEISPECIINDRKWRIVIEFKDKDGNLKERKTSDPKFYSAYDELNVKLMEMYFFYAGKI